MDESTRPASYEGPIDDITELREELVTWANGWVTWGDYPTAEDLVHDVFLSILENRATPYQPGRGWALLTWLKRLITSRAQQYRKQAARFSTLEEFDDDEGDNYD